MGSAWIMQLMIGFIFIFVAFLLLAMNFTKVYKLKNEVTSIVEKYEGITNSSNVTNNWGSVQIINNYLETSGYSAMGKCSENESDYIGERVDSWYGAKSLSSDSLEIADAGEKYYYCVRKHNIEDTKLTYFDIELFLKFDLPIVGNIITFKVDGTTLDIKGAYCTGLDGSSSKCQTST